MSQRDKLAALVAGRIAEITTALETVAVESPDIVAEGIVRNELDWTLKNIDRLDKQRDSDREGI